MKRIVTTFQRLGDKIMEFTETVSLLNDEDKKKVSEFINILVKKNKYNKLRK